MVISKFLNYGPENLRNPSSNLVQGSSYTQDYGRKIANETYAQLPKPAGRAIKFKGVSAGIHTVQSRHGDKWHGDAISEFPNLTKWAGHVSAASDQFQRKAKSIMAADQRDKKLADIAQQKQAAIDAEAAKPKPIKMSAEASKNVIEGPTSKVVRPYERLKKNAATRGVSEQTFDQEWFDWQSNKTTTNPAMKYGQPAAPVAKSPAAPKPAPVAPKSSPAASTPAPAKATTTKAAPAKPAPVVDKEGMDTTGFITNESALKAKVKELKERANPKPTATKKKEPAKETPSKSGTPRKKPAKVSGSEKEKS